jgi:hypothetical protein
MGNLMPYSIEEHRHNFAAWAASRAASVKGCRFKVEIGRSLLETAGMRKLSVKPDCLPNNIDHEHRAWRQIIIEKVKAGFSLNITHGVAAKLINVYLKSIFVCGGYHSHEKVKALHPPIDSLILSELLQNNIGELRKRWKHFANIGWSRFSSDEYEDLIENIKQVVQSGSGLWSIEEYWRGYQ